MAETPVEAQRGPELGDATLEEPRPSGELWEQAARPAFAVDYWFEASDVEGWKGHLDREGYAVVKGTADQAEVAHIKRLVWDVLELTHPLLKRDKPKSWRHLPVSPNSGICANLAQSEGQWYLRGLPEVKGVFEQLWGTSDLLTSMDCMLLRPPGALSKLGGSEGLHVDQNPIVKPVRECVQGMLPLVAVTAATGGLEVVPRSHLDDDFRARLKAVHWTLEHMRLGDDWCTFRPDTLDEVLDRDRCVEFYAELERRARLLLAEPGDLILWDSLTIHGGRVPDEQALEAACASHELARMSCTVAMTPRAFALPERIRALRRGEHVSLDCPPWEELDDADRELLAFRRRGFEKGMTFNHCPHQRSSTGTNSTIGRYKFHRPDLTAAREQLVDGNSAPPPQKPDKGPWRPRRT